MTKILGRKLYNYKKWEHKQKEDHGKAFGKSFNYEMGRKKAQQIAQGREHLKGYAKKVLDKFK